VLDLERASVPCCLFNYKVPNQPWRNRARVFPVVDLEATGADDGSVPPAAMEIIEIAAVPATADDLLPRTLSSD
jgi:hypothetical protein